MRKKLWLPPTRAPTGVKPLAWVCSPTRTRTRHLLVRGTTEPTGQDSPFPFFTRPQAPAHLGTACLFSLQVFLGRNTHTGSCWPQTGWFLDYSPCSSVLSKFPGKCTDRDTTREDTVSCSHGGEGSMEPPHTCGLYLCSRLTVTNISYQDTGSRGRAHGLPPVPPRQVHAGLLQQG